MRLISSTIPAPRPSGRQVAEKIGSPRSLHTTFYFPFTDRNNIRFDLKQEPMTALGDMAWYSMRAVVEYLRPEGRITKVVTVPERDPKTNAVVRASGLIAFDSGEVSTFDVGYTAGTIIMDLQLLGNDGRHRHGRFRPGLGDSFAFKNPDIKAGYTHRTGMATRKDVTFVPTPATYRAGGGDDRELRRTGGSGQSRQSAPLCRSVAEDAGISGCALGRSGFMTPN